MRCLFLTLTDFFNIIFYYFTQQMDFNKFVNELIPKVILSPPGTVSLLDGRRVVLWGAQS